MIPSTSPMANVTPRGIAIRLTKVDGWRILAYKAGDRVRLVAVQRAAWEGARQIGGSTRRTRTQLTVFEAHDICVDYECGGYGIKIRPLQAC
jgi:hypothetical protein